MTSRLFTSDYPEQRPRRRQELDWCLRENADAFDAMHVWSEGERPRPTFAMMLDWARELAGPDDLIVIANTDIVIPRASIDLMRIAISTNAALALSRWDMSRRGPVLFDVEYSQDCWVLCGKPKSELGGDYFFGIPGCDNRFASDLVSAGYRVTNPSRTIQTIHHHQSGLRTETNRKSHRVPKPYLFVKPTELSTANA